MNDQPKPATYSEYLAQKDDEDKARQPKPATGEWTKENMAGKWSRGEEWIMAEHNAAVAAAWRKGHADAQAPALERIDELHKQLAAERERSIDSMKHYDKQLAATNQQISALQKQLHDQVSPIGQQQLAAEREKGK